VEEITLLQVVTLMIATLGVILSLATFVRAGRWKEGEDAKALVKKVGDHDRRLTVVETEMRGLATKADTASILAHIDGIRDLVVRAENAVERVERHLMESGK
jgi:hypothetical protein